MRWLSGRYRFPIAGWQTVDHRREFAKRPLPARSARFPIPLCFPVQQYDLVCNGLELGGGSIRIHDAWLQRKVFRLLGHSDEQIEVQFGGMLRAFDFGAPPHGGIAMGIDRIAMLLRDTDNLREIVAFPKTQEGVDLAQRAPSAVVAAQLQELGLQLVDEPEPISYGD